MLQRFTSDTIRLSFIHLRIGTNTYTYIFRDVALNYTCCCFSFTKKSRGFCFSILNLCLSQILIFTNFLNRDNCFTFSTNKNAKYWVINGKRYYKNFSIIFSSRFFSQPYFRTLFCCYFLDDSLN